MLKCAIWWWRLLLFYVIFLKDLTIILGQFVLLCDLHSARTFMPVSFNKIISVVNNSHITSYTRNFLLLVGLSFDIRMNFRNSAEILYNCSFSKLTPSNTKVSILIYKYLKRTLWPRHTFLNVKNTALFFRIKFILFNMSHSYCYQFFCYYI